MLSFCLCAQPCPHSWLLRHSWRVPLSKWTDGIFETRIEQGLCSTSPIWLVGELRPKACQKGVFALPVSFTHLFIHSLVQQPSFLALSWELQTQRGIRQALPSGNSWSSGERAT